MSELQGGGRSTFAKLVTAFAVGMGLGFGTCGLVAATKGGEGGPWIDIAIGGAILFFASLLGILVVLALKAMGTFRQ